MSAPLPFRVNVPALKLALPASATAPISWSVQPGGRFAEGFTISVTFVLCVRPPPVPVMVSVEVPTGVLPVVVTVSVEVPNPPTEVGTKLPVAPDGSPLRLKFTVLLNPLTELMVTV